MELSSIVAWLLLRHFIVNGKAEISKDVCGGSDMFEVPVMFFVKRY